MKKQTKILSLALVSIFAFSCAHTPSTPAKSKSNKQSKEEVTQTLSLSTSPTGPGSKSNLPANVPDKIMGSANIDVGFMSKEQMSRVYYLEGAEELHLKNLYFDIPVVYNESVRKWVRYYTTRGKDFFSRFSERSGRYAPLLGRILEDKGLPRDLIFLAMAESGFQNQAKSWARAVGTWQFMPGTGKIYGLRIDWYIDERRDPIKATVAAATYLKKLYDDFGCWELATASYNAGEGKVSKAIKKSRSGNFWRLSRGRVLKPETKDYVPKIMAMAIIGKNLKSFGFDELNFHEPLDFEEINVPGNTDLVLLSDALGLPFQEVKLYNPSLLRWHTPPNETYTLRLPIGFKNQWYTCCSDKNFSATKFQQYVITKVQTLKNVAQQFKIRQVNVLENLNNMSAQEKLQKGSIVLLPFREGQEIRDAMYEDLNEAPAVKKHRGKRSRKDRSRAVVTTSGITSPSKGSAEMALR